MTEHGSPQGSQALESLAKDFAAKLAERYRIDSESAYAATLEMWMNNRKLCDQAAREPDPQRLKRTRIYKQAAEKAKASTYNSLRKYKQQAERMTDGVSTLIELADQGVDSTDPRATAARDQIVGSHVSTRERLPDLDGFHTHLFELIPEPTSILDIGCGLQPLLYPFHDAGQITSTYLGLDRDASVVEAVDTWARVIGGERLEARQWSLSEGFDGVVGPEPNGEFKLALGLKLIPVLSRQERKRLPLFRDVPAQRLLITGARHAMVKRRSIERRERASLVGFADELGFEVLETFETPTELGLLLETR